MLKYTNKQNNIRHTHCIPWSLQNHPTPTFSYFKRYSLLQVQSIMILSNNYKILKIQSNGFGINSMERNEEGLGINKMAQEKSQENMHRDSHGSHHSRP